MKQSQQLDELFIEEIRKYHLALKSNHNQLGNYQLQIEQRFIEICEKRPFKSIPFTDDQIDTGNYDSIFDSGESVRICE